MDKELLRITIISIGATVIIGMLLWSFFKNKNSRRNIDFIDKGNPLDNIDKSLILNTENDDFDIVPLGTASDHDFQPDPITIASEQESIPESKLEPQVKPQESLPSIIQFSLVSNSDQGFNGQELTEKFKQVGLEYGKMKIFERVDDQRRVDYAVASMIEPGTFPDTELELFNPPGIVFFIQPSELEQPLAIFDDFIQTINWLANQLDGEMLDHNRTPLTNETIQAFRAKLSG